MELLDLEHFDPARLAPEVNAYTGHTQLVSTVKHGIGKYV